jgi:hypothetical protein
MSQPEAQLKSAIRAALTALGYLTLRNEIGRRGRYSFGLGIGSSDIVVVLRPSGRMVCLEAKVGNAKPTAEQLAWGALVTSHGAEYHVVRSVDEAVRVVTEAKGRAA